MIAFLSLSAFAAEPDDRGAAPRDRRRRRAATASVAVIAMHVKTAHYERTMKMQVVGRRAPRRPWSRILEPAKDAGVTTLKVDENLWNYLPKVDRTMKVPAGMMSGAWMGSHFSNDDLVRESRLSEDFTCAFDGEAADTDRRRTTSIGCVAEARRPPVVWGKVVAHDPPRQGPGAHRVLRREGHPRPHHDLRGRSTRSTAGRPPMSMALTPHDKPGEFTRDHLRERSISTSSSTDAMFTLQALKP